jgi:hypothetical protein
MEQQKQIRNMKKITKKKPRPTVFTLFRASDGEYELSTRYALCGEQVKERLGKTPRKIKVFLSREERRGYEAARHSYNSAWVVVGKTAFMIYDRALEALDKFGAHSGTFYFKITAAK